MTDKNICIKTGGWVHLADADEYIYGDLYGNDTGTYWVRVLNDIEDNIQFDKPKGAEIWASLDKVDRVYKDGHISTYIGRGKHLFEWQWIDGTTKQVAVE